MSREAVNQIIDRAVADDTYFELLRNDPDRAVEGYELDPSELSAIRSGAYNVVVRGRRRDREEQTVVAVGQTSVPADTSARRASPLLVSDQTPPPAKAPVAGLIGFLIGILVIGGGIGGFRYVEGQWPWQALGLDHKAAPAAIPSPSLGARPKPSANP